MEEKTNLIWKDALKPSLILSLILIIFSVITYVFDLMTINMFASVIIGLLSLVIIFVSMIFLIKAYRNDKLDGFVSYGKALGFAVIIGLYASVILTSYNFIFNNVIDPDYEKNIMIKMQEKTEEYMIEKGIPDEVIEQQMEKMDEQAQKSTMRKTIGAFAGNFIIILIASLIAAAIVKKNPDPFGEETTEEVKE